MQQLRCGQLSGGSAQQSPIHLLLTVRTKQCDIQRDLLCWTQQQGGARLLLSQGAHRGLTDPCILPQLQVTGQDSPETVVIPEVRAKGQCQCGAGNREQWHVCA